MRQNENDGKAINMSASQGLQYHEEQLAARKDTNTREVSSHSSESTFC